MNKTLLDTDVYSEILKAINPVVIQQASAYRKHHRLFTISAITVMEIVKGCQQVQAFARRDRFLNAIAKEEVLPLRKSAATLAGTIAGDLDRTGQTIGMVDPIIAAIALENDLELVTGNTAHFERIVRLGYPLVLVNWR